LNHNILNIEIQEFITKNLNYNTTSILLKRTDFETVSTQETVEQIEAKNKSKTKLPTWYETSNIYYPNKLNIEQTSSEVTAEYKSHIISGNSIIDLTGGFGIDCYYFSKVFKKVVHCELNAYLQPISEHNFEVLEAQNITTIQGDGLEVLSKLKQQYDWIYIDPSRRHDSKGKVFYLSDCLPNVPEHLETLFAYSKYVLIKASPMLDISIGLKELKFVKAIHIVAVNNEVKELLFVLEQDYSGQIDISTVNLKKDIKQTFNFPLQKELDAISSHSTPKTYLYEPNAALMKSGAYKLISETLKVDKLHQHTHLYTSDELITFPGRRFKIIETLDYNKKVLKKKFANQKLNIGTRNFPEGVSQLKKQFKIKDGGHLYVFFTTNKDNKKTTLICEKA